MFRPMRIALVHYSAPPIVGGVEGIVAAQRQLFVRAGHEVRVVARQGDASHPIRQKEPTAELSTILSDCDLVIVHNVLTMPFDLPLTGALWSLAEKRPDIRWIAWIHDLAARNSDYDYPWHQAPWDQLARACPQFQYVAVSPHRARQFEALTRRAARVIPNGVDPAVVLGLTPNVMALAAAHRLFEREIVLFHPTRLVRRKNVEFGLEVLQHLRARGRDAVTLITAASDPYNERSRAYAEALHQRRASLGLEQDALFVADHFPVEGADVAALYSLAHALFFPSRQEGFGLPVVEAALHRVPIFCADVEPMNTLLTQSLHVFDPDSSAEEVAHLVERTLDRFAPSRARREALGAYSWDVIWRKHLEPLLRGSSSES
jgi:glycosyltransferase involved in cell wall biosynthesis